MTAINILRGRDSVSILTDAGVWGDDLRLTVIAPKCFPIPHCGAAIAVRGPAIGLPLIAQVLGAASSFADLKSHAVNLLRDAIGTIRAITKSEQGQYLQLFVAGISDSGPESFSILTAADSGLPAWELIPNGEICLCPFEPNGALHQEIFGIIGSRPIADLDPRVDGLAILEAQRGHPMRLPDGQLASIVGGFAQLTTVRPGSVTSEILQRWPDVIGELIDPGRSVH